MSSPLSYLTAILLLLCSCHKENTVIPEIDGESALKKVTEIYDIGPRPSGSEGARKTAEFIRDEIKKYGLSPEIDQWVEKTPSDTETTFRNVTTVIPGKTKDFIIIGSHYDTKKLETVPEFSGANDGASSSGLLLSLIKAVKGSPAPPPVTLVFAFFDGEECIYQYNDSDGLFGSRRMAAKLKSTGMYSSCRAVIILDMIGDKDLNISLPSSSDPALADKIIRIAGERNWGKYFTRSNANIIDDHTPFHKLGISAVDIIDFEFGENNRYWHTRADTIDKISPDSLKIVGDLVISLIYNWRRR
ncbi:MAG: M28 family peptidase [Victivallales bacterium]|jgi:glutaminyl-peptide cyclotransferase